ncbi:16S rRNA (guanine(527)-N(7))-methyltransferase RsmG [Anaerocolumna xylanovorans]|uniref:Ribosomal RNA small subunit methyltransferase G n=1 Tax=Anaerocolumna xylanovorans DSM 12503 TaxID=1121345 RepID=A0A1M7YNM6_9FIRM|nr:16S rRNA (guanine(527)-N(7))-methyltransferase RsmG [Anaerocolumna xylanovorans]SHO54264.1 16S rRNA m(7)G-527 methyltransferase [Anaerocolumna xylanovorans DSM 12503]
MDKEVRLLEEANKQSIAISKEQAVQLVQYYEMMIEKNKVMNLTAITDFEEVVTKHFIDSLSIVNIYDIDRPLSVIDVGTGAGFPGIPLKIVFPRLKITLMDSLNKRLNFLDEVISELNLKDIGTVHGRAEDLGRNNLYREKYDLCVSRAVANLSTLSEYCLPFVKVGGVFVSYKGVNLKEELDAAQNAVKRLGGNIKGYKEFSLNETIGRSFVVIEKTGNTSTKYPRTAGKPSKEPLS